ncbi:virulence factor BrkB family protein [Alteromonas sp. LMIT006]|uniref:virulence factor BrkB family protein n=1 Tax=Alteromonadaceae TaxID=72275 RepID=UPI0020CA6A85|nr:virulence factor BrkB family protein [Alteromonas sp. LMIT006]UTP73798.1 virulence factor BrkB family protein [Alteromonas sp. LMIT006]
MLLQRTTFPKLQNLLSYFVKRCQEDKITVSAGHLAYVSLLSLVPFIMVFFTILSAFPAFASVRQVLEDFIFNNFVPTSGDVVQRYVTEFVGNASEMGAIGIISLLVVALLLISNIDKTLNVIWRTRKTRPAVFTFAIYWMIITLGPILIGASVVVSTYLLGFAAVAEEYTAGLGTFLLKWVPSLLALIAFLIIFMLVPNTRVKFKHALAGAILSTFLFELSKKGFALYVKNFPSYELIYGALAVIPILFVWVYLSWIVVLIGAEFTCSVKEAKFLDLDENKEKNT